MKKTIFTCAAILLAFCATAAPISSKQIRLNAEQYAIQMKGGRQAKLTEIILPSFGHIHAFNINGGGFVIASSDDRTRPILAYSATGSIDADNLPENLRFWLSEYESQIRQLGTTTLSELQSNSIQPSKTSFPDSVAPLITSTWNQYRHGYNSMVPYDSTYASDSSMYMLENHPTVGCGALAMAQIMRYWQFPTHGFGQNSYSNSYPCWHYGTVSANFADAEYNYSIMPDYLTDSSTAEEVEAVATLMFHCGVAVNMNYNSDCAGSSGSSLTAVQSGMQRYFHYSAESNFSVLNYTDLSNWTEMLKSDLSAGRPVYYCGQSFRNDDEGTTAGGHAFICDGYDTADYFHFNWGWGGSSDGFYSLSVLRPLTNFDFTYAQAALFGLEPATHTFPILALASDLTLDSLQFPQNVAISGNYRITNLGDSTLNTFVGVNIYGTSDNQYKGCVDGRRVIVEPGDTVDCPFAYHLYLNLGEYQAVMQSSPDTFYAGIEDDLTYYFDDPDYSNAALFYITDPIEIPDTTSSDTTTVSILQPMDGGATSIFPNPATYQIAIEGCSQGTQIDIYNPMGQRVISTPYKGRPIDIKQLPAGIYLVCTPTQRIKLIKQ